MYAGTPPPNEDEQKPMRVWYSAFSLPFPPIFDARKTGISVFSATIAADCELLQQIHGLLWLRPIPDSPPGKGFSNFLLLLVWDIKWQSPRCMQRA